MILTAFLIVLGILLAGFYNGSETGAYRVNRLRVQHEMEKGSLLARLTHGCIRDMARLVCTTLVASNAAVYVASMLVTGTIQPYFKSEVTADVVSTLVLSPVLLIISDVVPKSMYQVFPQPMMRWSAPLLWITAKLLWPVTTVLLGLVTFWQFVFRVRGSPHDAAITTQYLNSLLAAGAQEGTLSPQQDVMVRNVMQLGARRVRTIMIPLADLHMLPVNASPEAARKLMAQYDHERFPVYHGTRENIIGMVRALDYLCEGGELPPLMRKPVYIQAGLSIDEAFRQLQAGGQLAGVVVDSHNRAVGLITVDDLLREVMAATRKEP
jgi:putative hemolysin